MKWFTFLFIFISCSLCYPKDIEKAELNSDLDQKIKVYDQFNYDLNSSGLSSNDVSQIIPTNMPSGSNQTTVTRKILDHSMRTALKRLRKSKLRIVRSIHDMSQKLETNIVIKSSPKQSKSIEKYSFPQSSLRNEEPEITHKLFTKLNLFQQSALLRYSGFFNAQMSHALKNKETTFEISTDLKEDLKLALLQNFKGPQTTSKLNFTFKF